MMEKGLWGPAQVMGTLLLAPARGQEEQLWQHPCVKAKEWQEIPSRSQHTLQEALNQTPGVWSWVSRHLLSSSSEEASWKGDTQQTALTGTER